MNRRSDRFSFFDRSPSGKISDQRRNPLEILHKLLIIWFDIVRDLGYSGVFFLMALESSIVPIPSEVVMPPAAFWASQGKMNFVAVVAAGTAGSYFGSILSYLVSRYLGYPVVVKIVEKYGKYIFLSLEKIDMAQAWIARYGSAGIFFARLLPVVRHLVSIPAGVFKMKPLSFTISTISGALLWCLVLSWYGAEAIGSNPELLSTPEAMVSVIKGKLQWFIGGVFAFAVLYIIVMIFQRAIKKRGVHG